MRHRRQRARGARGLRHVAARRARLGRDRGARDARGPDRGVARCARLRFASGRCAPSRTGTSPRRRSRASRSGSRSAPARSGRSSRPSRTGITPSVDAFLAHAEEVRERTGWSRSFTQRRVERISVCDGGFELDGEGPFAHVLVATGHPGLARPSDYPGAVHAYEPHEYASRVAIVGAGHGGGDRVAERAGCRRRGRLDPAARAAPPPAERAAPVLLEARPRRLPRARATSERAAKLRELSAPSFPPGPAWDEPLAQAEREGRFRVELVPNGAEQVICATGFRRGFREDPLLARLVADHESRDVRPLDRPRARLDRPRAHRRQPDALARGRRRASGPFPPPTRSRARSTPPAPSSAGYVVHAERTHRVAARVGRAGARPRARAAPLVGDRARGADARARPRARHRRLSPGASRTSPAGSRFRSGSASSRSSTSRCTRPGSPRRCDLALVLYAVAWLGALVLGHAVFPRLRLEYGESGGELGRGRRADGRSPSA